MTTIFNLFIDFITAGLYSQYMIIKAPLGFQQAASPSFYNIIEFHDYIIVFLVFIFLIVLWHLFWAINLSKILYPVLLTLVLVPAILNFFRLQYETFKQIEGFHELFISKTISFEDGFSLYYLFLEKYEVENYESIKNYLHSLCIYAYACKNPIFYYIVLQYIFFISFIFFLIKNTNNFNSIYSLLFNEQKNTINESNEMTKEYDNKRAEYLFYKHYLFVQQQLRKLTHAPLLEIVWTIFPSFILLAIAIPSLILLYQLDNVEPVSLCIKVIGHQWYWTYEIGATIPIFSDLLPKSFTKITSGGFDSYMLSDELTHLRLLEVDNPLFVPVDMPLTFMITSTDVLHSWAVPSLGVKVDAIPGRLNRVGITVLYPGIFYGQCSELCGINHGFMPINIISYHDSLYE